VNITWTATATHTYLATPSINQRCFVPCFVSYFCYRSAATPAPHPAQPASASAAPPALLFVPARDCPPTSPPTRDGLQVFSPTGVDVPPSPSDRAAFWNHHLAATRPDKIQVKFKNGRIRTYEMTFEPRKPVVAARQMRRRIGYASAAVTRILGLEPELIRAAMDDICRRAMHCGCVAVAPTVPLSALPVRLQTQFIIDNNVSGALFQKLRLLLWPAAGLASRERLRADRALAEAEEPHVAGTNGGGAYLLSPRAALQATFDHAVSKKQFLERLLRGADGREIQVTTSFSWEDSPATLPPPGVPDVQICFGLDKGGVRSTCKAVISSCNQEHPSSRGNTVLYGVFPTAKDDHDALAAMASV